MIAPDVLPAWLWVPLAIVLWSWLIVSMFRDAAPDPDDELTGLDVLERTGAHPHG